MDFDTRTGELFLYGDIGPAEYGMIDTKQIQTALKKIGPSKRATLRISSPGGVFDEAVNAYNLLQRHPAGVHTAIDAVAASAAGFLALVGQRITMAANSAIMLHKAWGRVSGNADKLRERATQMDFYDSRQAEMYAARSGATAEQVLSMLEMGETWLNAEQALKAGIVDEIANPVLDQPDLKLVSQGRYLATPAAYLTDSRQRLSVMKARARIAAAM